MSISWTDMEYIHQLSLCSRGYKVFTRPHPQQTGSVPALGGIRRLNLCMRPGVANLYEHHLLEFADKLTRELEPAGYEVWFDRTDIQTGTCWDDEIVKGLDASDDFIVLLSTKSTEAQNVKDEIGYALDHKKQSLPILLEACEVPFRLRWAQYLDFTVLKFNKGIQMS